MGMEVLFYVNICCMINVKKPFLSVGFSMSQYNLPFKVFNLRLGMTDIDKTADSNGLSKDRPVNRSSKGV